MQRTPKMVFLPQKKEAPAKFGRPGINVSVYGESSMPRALRGWCQQRHSYSPTENFVAQLACEEHFGKI